MNIRYNVQMILNTVYLIQMTLFSLQYTSDELIESLLAILSHGRLAKLGRKDDLVKDLGICTHIISV
ncbi:hypothetical protein SD074_05090 [Prolixibacter sp. SD074]|nr:hypothetical protein SD074_05090 [Prolixibacter sp. SD074]